MNPIMGGFGPAAGAIDNAGSFFNLADQRLALANQVTGNETPDQIRFLGQKDKELSLKQVQANTNYLYDTAWQDQLDRMRKKETERRQQRIANGVIFG